MYDWRLTIYYICYDLLAVYVMTYTCARHNAAFANISFFFSLFFFFPRNYPQKPDTIFTAMVLTDAGA